MHSNPTESKHLKCVPHKSIRIAVGWKKRVARKIDYVTNRIEEKHSCAQNLMLVCVVYEIEVEEKCLLVCVYVDIVVAPLNIDGRRK